MSQGVEFNRLMLDMRAMQADAMSLPKVCLLYTSDAADEG